MWRCTDSTPEPCAAPPNPAFLGYELSTPISSFQPNTGGQLMSGREKSFQSFSFLVSQRCNTHRSDLGLYFVLFFPAFTMIFILFPVFRKMRTRGTWKQPKQLPDKLFNIHLHNHAFGKGKKKSVNDLTSALFLAASSAASRNVTAGRREQGGGGRP